MNFMQAEEIQAGNSGAMNQILRGGGAQVYAPPLNPDAAAPPPPDMLVRATPTIKRTLLPMPMKMRPSYHNRPVACTAEQTRVERVAIYRQLPRHAYAAPDAPRAKQPRIKRAAESAVAALCAFKIHYILSRRRLQAGEHDITAVQ